MSKTGQWIAGINAVSSALEHDIEHVREVLVEAGNKNARIVEIEDNARRREVSVRRVSHQALEGIAGGTGCDGGREDQGDGEGRGQGAHAVAVGVVRGPPAGTSARRRVCASRVEPSKKSFRSMPALKCPPTP